MPMSPRTPRNRETFTVVRAAGLHSPHSAFHGAPAGVAKEKGVVTSTTLTVVSPDGYTRTSTTTAVNAQGKTVANIAVHDRQR
jgi:hypothetical protein